MQATALLNYPEFFLAGLLSLVVLFVQGTATTGHWPVWLSSPSLAALYLLPSSYLAWLRKMLIYADWRSNSSPGDFACWKLYPCLLSLLAFAFLPPQAACAIPLIAFWAPDMVLFFLVRKRQQEVRLALPQALDLMVLCVDAGLGLDATLQRVSSDDSGIAKALNDELSILGRDILLGVDRDKAYQDLFVRTGVDELKTLGSALNQASKLGLSIAKILRAQSEFIRKRISQQAEEKALKMPILMAFPLWFCIMPSLMLLVLGPSLIRFYNALHNTMGM
jgi:Flp pilus assembly protein TadB